MAEPIFVVAKGTQKGFIFLYETLKASMASLKTCSFTKQPHKQSNQDTATMQDESASLPPLQVMELSFREFRARTPFSG